MRNGSPMPSFNGWTLLPYHTVPAVCTGPPCSKWSNLWRRPDTWHPPEISLISTKPQQSLTLLIGVLLKNQKNISNHYCCPISAVILLTSKLEAILEICRCSLKLSKRVRVWGGLSPVPLVLITLAAGR